MTTAPNTSSVNNQAMKNNIQIIRGTSGVEAWLVEDYTVPLVSIDFAFLGGASQEAPEKAGLTNLLSGLYDEGAGDLKAEDFQDAMEDKAIEISFDASRDILRGSMRTLVGNLARATELLALCINKPRFDNEAFKRVSAQILAGLRQAETEPNALAFRAFSELAFPNHAYGRSVRGTLASIPTLTRKDIQAQHKKLVAHSNVKIGIVGAITAARAKEIVDEIFGALPATANLDTLPVAKMSNRGSRRIVELNVPQTTLAFGLDGIAVKDPDFPAAALINHIFGGGTMSSRLWNEVREKRGLAYSVWSALGTGKYGPSLYGSTATANNRVAESLSIIEAEIKNLAEIGATSDEIEKARSYIIGNYPLRFDTSRKIAALLVELQTDDLGIDFIDQRNARFEAVTKADIERVTQRLFGNPALVVAMAGKPEGIEAR